MLTERDVLAQLNQSIEAAGGVRAFARKHRLSPAYASRAARGEIPIGQKIEHALGLRRVVGWEPA